MALGALALAGCQASNGNGGAEKDTLTWDEEADVVVMGYGYAGESAAIAASEAGSTVIVLEKAPEKDCGGNSSCCGGGCQAADPEHPEEAKAFLDFQLPDTIDEDERLGFLEELYTTGEWLEAHGATLNRKDKPGGMYNTSPYAIGFGWKYYPEGNGYRLYTFLRDIVETDPNITVEFETAGVKLIFDPETKEVFGVVAMTSDGTTKNIKAKKGVVMACGGFEGNHYMKTAYMPPNVSIYGCGTPYNTGDGFPMVEEVNAQLRGFSSVEWGCHACKPASEEMGVFIGNNWTDAEVDRNAIFVNYKGKRFVDETGQMSTSQTTLRPIHVKDQIPELAFDTDAGMYRNLPMYLICGQTRFNDGPLFSSCTEDATTCFAKVHDWHTWSNDNEDEVSRGWITKADTLEELAEKLGIDAQNLVETVANYDAYCADGIDPEFGRTRALSPVGDGPYYGCELGMGLINTQGGPRRDGAHHVINNDGEIVPRLYSAGEFGSIYVFLYQGAGNVPEALGGRVAGENAAAETPWDSEEK